LMSLWRVMMWVHRPTDILMWWFLGILAGWIVSSVRVVSLFDGMIHYLISLEEKILSRCWWKQ
jgi:membrane-associated phospholipid phosphatase